MLSSPKVFCETPRLSADICIDVDELLQELKRGADTAIVTEEAIRSADLRALADWVSSQPAWSDFPFIILTEHGGGIERNPSAANLIEVVWQCDLFGTAVSSDHTHQRCPAGLRSRAKQHECRRLNEDLEGLVHDRTAELAAANHQLVHRSKSGNESNRRCDKCSGSKRWDSSHPGSLTTSTIS